MTTPATPAVVVPVQKTIAAADVRRDRATGEYHVSLDTGWFYKGNDEVLMFIVWLYQRFSDEVIHLSFRSGGDTYLFPDAYITIANAIRACPAKVIIYVDHNLSGVESYIALAAKSLVIRDFGMIQVSPVTNRDNSLELTGQMAAVADYYFSVLDDAVVRGWLTSEERDQVRGGYWVNLYSSELSTRVL